MLYFRELGNAIKRKHGCEAVRLRTASVREAFRDEMIWDAAVEVFALLGHDKAKCCYAWGIPRENEADGLDVVTVLEIPPVMSPESAVRAALLNGKAPPRSCAAPTAA